MFSAAGRDAPLPLLQAGATRLVRVSSFGIDAVGQGPLGDAHVRAERYCRESGLSLSSVRPTSFHTNFAKYDAASIRELDVFRSPLGLSARVNWVHCRDIGKVAADVLACVWHRLPSPPRAVRVLRSATTCHRKQRILVIRIGEIVPIGTIICLAV